MDFKKVAKRITFLPRRLWRTMVPPKNSDRKYGIAIVAIAKNEREYIEEWVKYHKLIGVEKIFLYNNGSTDDTTKILKPYIKSDYITLIDFPGTGKQLPAYNDALKKYAYLCKYMAFIDVDEFLYVYDHKSLYNVIEEIMAKDLNAGGVAVNWRMFGSSGYISKPEGGVLENFLWRAKEQGKGNACIKTIVCPQYVFEYAHPHYPTYIFGKYSIDETGKRVDNWYNPTDELHLIRINHYFTKSKEEWIKRRSMGTVLNEKDKRTLDEFYQHDNNDIYDDSMLYYVRLMD